MTDDHTTADAAGQPMPYREVTEDRYAESAQNFTIEEPRPGTLVLRGPCPRCEAIIDIPVVSGIFRSSRLLGSRGPHNSPATGQIEPMMCTCEDDHPGRPEGAFGCGAYWTLVLSRQH
jgi:hypothetical protein